MYIIDSILPQIIVIVGRIVGVGRFSILEREKGERLAAGYSRHKNRPMYQ